jgi:hypothetical protein
MSRANLLQELLGVYEGDNGKTEPNRSRAPKFDVDYFEAWGALRLDWAEFRGLCRPRLKYWYSGSGSHHYVK